MIFINEKSMTKILKCEKFPTITENRKSEANVKWKNASYAA
jgi:hypothetical protein